MLIAGLGVVAALAFVLGLGAVCLWALKRWGTGALTGRQPRLPVEVVQRVALGPKAGLAVVRVGEKVMAMSVGEGGIQPLFELDERDRQRVIATSPIPVALTSSIEAAAAFAPLTPTALGTRFGSLLGQTLGKEAPAHPMPCEVAAPVSVMTMEPAPSAAVRPFSMGEPAEVPRFLTAPLRTREGAPVTYAPWRVAVLAAFLVGSSLVGASPRALEAQVAAPPAPPTAAPTAPALPVPVPPAAPAPETGAGLRTARPAQTVPARALPARQGNNTSVNRQGTAAARPTMQMVLDSTRSADQRASAATPAPIAADEAILRMMPQMDLQLGGGAGEAGGLRLNGTVGIVVMMGLLTLLPTLLLMMTGFTRILIVLHFLKQAMGTQSAPPGHLLAGMALLLTGFVMAPTLTEVNQKALTPWMDGKITQVEMMKTGVQPLRGFMLRQTRESDLRTFIDMSRMPKPATVDEVPLHILMSAFVASELRTAFQIGFAIYLPFIIIDAVVASVLMSMGMFMLPPAMISLPFKLLLFVLVDGWNLTITSLVQSFR
jgi:flagellar biosynthetic protein FliP